MGVVSNSLQLAEESEADRSPDATSNISQFEARGPLLWKDSMVVLPEAPGSYQNPASPEP